MYPSSSNNTLARWALPFKIIMNNCAQVTENKDKEEYIQRPCMEEERDKEVKEGPKPNNHCV